MKAPAGEMSEGRDYGGQRSRTPRDRAVGRFSTYRILARQN